MNPHIKEIPAFADDRGIFTVFTDNNEIAVKRVYYVINPIRSTIRGFHFHSKEWKYFTIIQGSAKFIALNPESPEKKFIFVSSEKEPSRVCIPPGFANGWVSLEDNTILLCVSTSSTEESKQDDVRFDPYQWGDLWSVKGK